MLGAANRSPLNKGEEISVSLLTQSSSLPSIPSLFSTTPVIQREENEERSLGVEGGGLGAEAAT